MKELEWNLSTLITGEEEFKTKIEKIKVKLKQLENYQNKPLTKKLSINFPPRNRKDKRRGK